MVRARNSSHYQDDPTLTFVISVAAELAGMHPQTLRQYDRLGLVIPARTQGRGRRYTSRDIQRLRQIQHLSQQEGINLEGIRRILDLERRVEQLEAERDHLHERLAELEERRNRVFAASATGRVRQLRRGERSFVDTGEQDTTPSDTPVALQLTRWQGDMRGYTYIPRNRRIRAVIEPAPAHVHVLEGHVVVVDS
ncbi:heat shock protein transcriptional repressor HspR [Schaalia sp. lx-100]|uniref:heat shock protein transcriptional repressor HspR n=1 Tax=Schaalia sp. lx-100 TaxID=2899081 RepID=UPI001E3B3B5D|nr:helix-turn-helix transcriptional regulator [Schaalia sp. lx-100]MCD4557654.1 helix-turn-helix transcriptional regulator [Schaalia sp. lx-100]